MWLLYPDKASSGSYLDSAHANTSDGVKRSATGFPTDYSQGNCAHCHEQHASITGAEPTQIPRCEARHVLAIYGSCG